MSLVDKLDGVHVGDLLSFEYNNAASNNAETSVVGYVAAYTQEKIKLSNMYTRTKNGEIRNFSFLQTYWKERIATFHLSNFTSYKVLQKYEAPKKD